MVRAMYVQLQRKVRHLDPSASFLTEDEERLTLDGLLPPL
jgi:hypothetical protein